MPSYRRVASIGGIKAVWSAKTAMSEKVWNSFFILSNHHLLILTTSLFGLFVISEIIGGIIANSLSLLGDATAMSVDVLTYCGNIYGEYLKNDHGKIDQKTIIITEILVPSLSLIALVGVSAWVSYDASLRLRGHKEEDVQISFMYIFPIANFVVDIYCTCLFFLRRHDIFHHQPVHIQITSDYDFSADFSDSSSDSSGHDIELTDIHHHRLERTNLVSSKSQKSTEVEENLEKSTSPNTETNVNMMSAFTHVSGDTLRTISTIVAAGVSSYFHIDPSICDAWAAIIVSASIVFSAIPLVYSISRTISTVYHNTNPTSLDVSNQNDQKN